MFYIIFIILVLLFLVNSSNLLISLLILEILTFIALYFVSLSVVSFSDLLVVSLFSVFVLEGVIALAGLIVVVSFSGSDYVSSSSLSKC